MNHKTLVFFCLILLSAVLYSAWLDDVPSILTQPDGATIDVLLSGDEFHNWAHDDTGHTIIQDPITGFWCWAKAENGNLVSTGYPIHLYSPQSLGISPNENISTEQYNTQRSRMSIDLEEFQQRSGRSELPRTNSTGTMNNLVIFIRFSDQTEFTRDPSFYGNMFNEEGENANSQYQYFYEASYGSLEVYTHLYPIDNGVTVLSYQDIHPRSYYMPLSATNPNGYVEGAPMFLETSRIRREHKLLERAIIYVRNQIPTNLNLDYNNDGFVDNICFIIRGDATAWSTLLWPHKWSLYFPYYEDGDYVYIHGKAVWEYNLLIDDRNDHSGVGVIAHELAHTFNIPDLYRYNYSGAPVGIWDLMARTTNPPQSISAYLKHTYTDWINNIPTITTEGTYILYPLTTHYTQNAFRINASNEFFVLEYRNNSIGNTDSTIPGSGILIYRANPNAGWGNADGPPDELYVFRQNGTPQFDGLLNNAFFSAASGRTAFNSNTNPYPFLGNGNPASINISNIGHAGETISFDFNIVTTVDTPPQNLTAESGNSFVDLQWEFPSATVNLYGFRVYRDQMPIADILDLVTFYTDNEVQNGYSYEYFITALFQHYMPSESTPSNVCNVSIYVDPLRPAVDLVSSVTENTVFLNWNSYVEEGGVFSHTLSDDVLYEYELQVPRSYAYAHRWTPEQLVENRVAGTYLESVQFRAISLNANYKLQLWSGGSENPYNPGKMIHEQIIPNSSINLNAWTNITLTTPIIIPFHKELWISIFIDTPGDCSIPMDAGPNLEGFGNILIHTDGATTVFLNSGEINNWMIKGVANNSVSTENSNGFLGYNVFRNDILVNNAPTFNLYFSESNVPDGIYTYKVIALYETGNSIPALINVSVGNTSEFEPPLPHLTYVTNLQPNFPNPFNPETNITFTVGKSHERVNINIYNLKGQKVKTLVDKDFLEGIHTVIWNGTDDMGLEVASGLYFYKMHTDSYTSTKKMILMK